LHAVRKIAVTFAATAAVLGAGAAVASASSAADAITGTTQVTAQPDTTGGPGTDFLGTACDTTSTYAKAYGPVWADDDFKATLSATPTGTDQWAVTIRSTGTFAGFADPVTCDAALSDGTVYGTVRYTLTSDDVPSQAHLQSSYTDFSNNLTGLVQAFFGDPGITSADLGDGTYSYSYQGGNMTEDNNGLYGDVNSNGGAVAGLAVTQTSDSSVALNWDATAGATGYNYQVSGAGIASPVQTTTDTTAAITGLTPGTAYTFTVSALPSGTGESTVTYTILVSPTTDVVTVTVPKSRDVVKAGKLFSVDAHATSSLGKDGWKWSVTSNHPIPDLRITGGVVKGRPRAGAYYVTVVGTDSSGAHGSVTFRLVAKS
jgi:Fibronectin type III domain